MTKSLIEIGNLDNNEIKTILSQQQEIVKQYVIDIAQPFVENKQGKWRTNCVLHFLNLSKYLFLS